MANASIATDGFVSFLQAATPSTTGGFTSTILMMAALVAIFYFFLIRPQNKKQKETEKMLAALKKGDKVVTIGGIHGVVSSVKDKIVTVKVAGDVKIDFNRAAIASVENPEAPAKSDKKDKKGKDADIKNDTSKDKAEEDGGSSQIDGSTDVAPLPAGQGVSPANDDAAVDAESKNSDGDGENK